MLKKLRIVGMFSSSVIFINWLLNAHFVVEISLLFDEKESVSVIERSSYIMSLPSIASYELKDFMSAENVE